MATTASSTPLAPLSAAVTRILLVSGFSSLLKTKDLLAAFQTWENVNGGYKVKWQDDTSAFIVFESPVTAKRAYLQSLLEPPTILQPPQAPTPPVIRPYTGPDAQMLIHAVNSRRGTGGRAASVSAPNAPSINRPSGNSPPRNGSTGLNSSMHAEQSAETTFGSNSLKAPVQPYEKRNGSPTLPDLDTHPTLDSLINSSFSDMTMNEEPEESTALSPSRESTSINPPRVGDAARRMMGAALGVKHPGLQSRRSHPNSGEKESAVDDLAAGANGITVSD